MRLIDAAEARGAHAERGRLAHQLKGAAANVCAGALAAAASAVETAPADDRVNHVAQLREVWKATRRQLSAALKEPGEPRDESRNRDSSDPAASRRTAS
jgi:HPt (histidine-containing phosphotransfer) domain-containing protein